VTRLSRSAAIAAAAVLLLPWSSQGAAAARKPTIHRLTIDATAFTPELLTVRAGDTIVWTNNDPFPHTVTSEAGGFDSKVIAPGQSWRYKAVKKGEFPYACTLHPSMKARLKVQ
jgi:plastocyanin